MSGESGLRASVNRNTSTPRADAVHRQNLSIIIICPGLDSRPGTALEHMLESVVSARGEGAEDELLGDQPR